MRRYPLKFLITKNFHKFVTSKIFIDIAKEIFEDSNLALFGSFNLRIKIKEQSWNKTPEHADWQAWENWSNGSINTSPNDCDVFTFWTPLNDVDQNSSCLRISNCYLTVEENNFLRKNSLSIEKSHLFPDIKYVDLKLSPKDLLIFNHKIVHCSNPNLTEEVIWVADWRYQIADKPYEGMKYGFKIPNINSQESLDNSFRNWENKIKSYSPYYK